MTKIDELLAMLDRAIEICPHIEHDKNGDDSYCLICKAKRIANKLAKELAKKELVNE